MATGIDEKVIPKLDVNNFCEFLKTRFDEDVSESFRANKISGDCFLKLTEEQIGKMVTAVGDIVELMALQSRLLNQVLK